MLSSFSFIGWWLYQRLWLGWSCDCPLKEVVRFGEGLTSHLTSGPMRPVSRPCGLVRLHNLPGPRRATGEAAPLSGPAPKLTEGCTKFNAQCG